MSKEFINRKNELASLRDKYEKLSKGELLVMFGRRRVGKTELVKEFMVKAPQKLYIYIDLVEKQDLLNSFSSEIHNQLGEDIKFSDFDGFFDYIHKKSGNKFILVIDEFQRFLDIAPEFITKMQNYWDSKLKHDKILIILVGSSIGMMQKIISNRAGALYGRASRMKVSPFRYADFRLMFNDLPEEEKIVRYAVFGGTPYYLDKARGFTDTKQAISELILKRNAPLQDEPKNLMESEHVRVYSKYNSILHAVASGKETLKEIQDLTNISATTMPAYIIRLDGLLDILGKHDPVLGKQKLGRYMIKDNFFRFWYKFIFPNQTALNLGNAKLVSQIIESDLNSYVGRIYEEIIRQLFVLYQNKQIKGVDINFENIGSWWDRNGQEIDIVAYNNKEKKILVGEVKWQNKPCDLQVLDNLMRKAKLLDFSGQYNYVLVSKSGFTEECITRMRELNVLDLDLIEVSKLFDKGV